ncbi:hypothetical protein L1987_85771 [Smallanthus sonchifolius]|uniref:Uncharacterized protein n=1 Tax=Smallanthus sonchifolius TaxID=185202 RepID=A0ACB8XXN1_9ASTR|nr:hypothetical protein L1987_85771 [Smallanthus sonchifolius]
MKEDGTDKDLRFWNTKNLKIRDRLEIKGGGFRRGKLKLLKSVLHTKLHDKDIDIDRQQVEKPENEEVLSLVARYNSSFKSICTGENTEADYRIRSVLEGLKVNEKDCSGNGKNEGEISENENYGSPENDCGGKDSSETREDAGLVRTINDNSGTIYNEVGGELVGLGNDKPDDDDKVEEGTMGGELVRLGNDKPDDEDKVEEGRRKKEEGRFFGNIKLL